MKDIEKLPSLLRQARVAVANHAYKDAESLYALILKQTEMKDHLDLNIRHAFCAEKIGETELALKSYQAIVVFYHELGEVEQAEQLEQRIAALYAADEAEVISDLPSAQTEIMFESGDVVGLDDETLVQELCAMGSQHSLQPHEMLCEVGDIAEHLWFINHGIIDICEADLAEKHTLEAAAGSLVLLGELGLFTKQRRIATLIAHTAVQYTAIAISKISQRRQVDAVFDNAIERLMRERWVEPVLKQHVVFERINDIDRKHLAHSFERISLNPGEVLIAEDEKHRGAYLLQSGCMFFTYHKTEDEAGSPTLVTGIFPGDVFHLRGLLRGYQQNYRITAATAVEVLYLSREKFETFSQRRPWLIQAIVRYSHRPAHLQVMHPHDDYLWQANRDIKLCRAT